MLTGALALLVFICLTGWSGTYLQKKRIEAEQPRRHPAMAYTFDDYHADVSGFAAYPNLGKNLVYPALGVAGEAGELADKIKKLWRNYNKMHISELDRAFHPELQAMSTGMLKEAGDVLWYLDAVATECGTSLSSIARLNARKLADRAARGVIKSEGDNR